MALVNILAKSDFSLSWQQVFKRTSSLSLLNVEILPIPKELGFEQDCIGLSVQNRHSGMENVILELKQIFEVLCSFELKYFELYNGNEVTIENINDKFK